MSSNDPDEDILEGIMKNDPLEDLSDMDIGFPDDYNAPTLQPGHASSSDHSPPLPDHHQPAPQHPPASTSSAHSKPLFQPRQTVRNADFKIQRITPPPRPPRVSEQGTHAPKRSLSRDPSNISTFRQPFKRPDTVTYIRTASNVSSASSTSYHVGISFRTVISRIARKSSPSVRFFLIQVSELANLRLSQKYGLYGIDLLTAERLRTAFDNPSRSRIFLTFASPSCFHGYAEMMSSPGTAMFGRWINMENTQDFGVKWTCKTKLSFELTSHLAYPDIDRTPVQQLGNGHELPTLLAKSLADLLEQQAAGALDKLLGYQTVNPIPINAGYKRNSRKTVEDMDYDSTEEFNDTPQPHRKNNWNTRNRSVGIEDRLDFSSARYPDDEEEYEEPLYSQHYSYQQQQQQWNRNQNNNMNPKMRSHRIKINRKFSNPHFERDDSADETWENHRESGNVVRRTGELLEVERADLFSNYDGHL